MNKWTQWYESLPEHTKQSLKHRAIWTDADLAKMAVFAFTLGVILGKVV